MFSKQNQPNQQNSVDAREAVKKQLLRSLMQQVVDEVSKLDEASFNEMVQSVVADVDTSSLRARVENQIESKFEKSLQDLNLDARIGETEDRLSLSVQELLDERVGSLASDMVKVRLADINLHTLQQDLESQTRQVLEEKLSTIDLDNIVEVNKDALLADIEASLQKKTAEISEGVVHDFQSNLNNQFARVAANIEQQTAATSSEMIASFQKEVENLFESETKKASDSVLAQLETRVTEVEQQWNELSATRLESGLDRARKEVVSRTEKIIKKDSSGLQSEITQIISDEFKKNFETVDIAKSVSEHKAKLLETVANDLNSQVRMEADAIVTEQISSFDVSGIQKDLDQKVYELVNERIQAVDFDEIVESNRAKVVSEVDQSLKAKAVATSSEMIASFQKEVENLFESETKKASDSVLAQLETRVTEVEQQWNELSATRLESGLDRARKEVVSRTEKIIKKDSSGLQSEITQIISDEFKKNFETVDIANSVSEHKAKLLETVANDLNSQVRMEADAIVSEQISSFDVSGIQKELDQKVYELINERIQAVDFDEIIESNRAKVVSETDQSLKAKAESITSSLIKSIKSSFNKKLAAVSKSESTELTKQLSQYVADALIKDAPTVEVVVENASKAVVQDEKWIETAKNRVTAELAQRLGTVAKTSIEQSTETISDAANHVYQDFELIASLVENVKGRVVEQIAERTLAQLSDADQTAKAATDHFAFEHDSLISAIGILRTNVLKDVANRTLVTFGDAESIQEDARKWVNEGDSFIQLAVAEVVKTANQVISVLVHQQMSDTESVVRKIAPEFTADTIQIRNAVKASRQELVSRITDFVKTELEDTDKVAQDSSAQIMDDHEAVQKAVRLTVSKMVDEIISLTETRLHCTDRISEEARGRMPKDIPTVVQAADVLENMLLSEVAAYATKRLYEVGLASEKASAFLKADKEIEAVRKALSNKILEAIASDSTADLADTNAVAKRAFHKVDMETVAVVKAIDQVRDQLVASIAESASSRISDVASVVTESRALIPATHASIIGATNKVYDMLIQDVADKSLASVSESDKTAEIVLSRVQEETEVISRVQEIVHDQMIERLLAHALQEIKDKVSDGSHEAEKAFFKSSLKVFAEPVAPSNMNQPLVSEPLVSEPSVSEPEVSAVNAEPSVSPTQETVASIAPELLVSIEPEPSAPESAESDQPVSADVAPERNPNDWTLLSDIQESPRNESSSVDNNQDQSSLDESDNVDVAPSDSTPTPKLWSVSEFTVNSPSTVKTPAGDGSNGLAPEIAEIRKNLNEPTFYMYGIVSTNQVVDSMFAGIEGLQERSVVYSLPCGNLTAIVSKLTDTAFSPYVIRKSMRDNGWLKDQVRHHAGVLSEAKGLMTIIPLRFGTVFSSENGIRRFVETQRSKMLDTLSRLQDKSEFGIRVVCDAERLLSSAEFKGIVDQQKYSKDGGFSLDAIMANVARRIHAPLNDMASEAVSKGVPAAQTAENMIVALNSTYLVPVVGEKNFRARVTTLAQEMRNFGVTIEVSGPWPPYHFVDVDMGGSEEYFMSEIPA